MHHLYSIRNTCSFSITTIPQSPSGELLSYSLLIIIYSLLHQWQNPLMHHFSLMRNTGPFYQVVFKIQV